MRKLFKSTTDKKICGVCGGFAEYFGVDSTIIRLALAVFTCFSFGTGIFVYFIAALVMPEGQNY